MTPPYKKGSENMDRKTQIEIFRCNENQTIDEYVKNINEFLSNHNSKQVTPLTTNTIIIEYYI